jgi:hypothetical protein
VSPSEVARLKQTGRIEDTIHFSPEPEAKLTYVLEHTITEPEISIRYRPQEVTVVLSTERFKKWAESQQVGVQGSGDLGDAQLALLVEKDFACLDQSHPDNEDTFENPNKGKVC